MCKVFNTIGSLTSIKKQLHQNNIYSFNSVKEIINFQEDYHNIKGKLIAIKELELEEEEKTLKAEISQIELNIDDLEKQIERNLKNEIEEIKIKLHEIDNLESKNLFRRIARDINSWSIKKQLKNKERNFFGQIRSLTRDLYEVKEIKEKRYKYINSNFELAVRESTSRELEDLYFKKKIIDSLSSFIYGAIGEQKVVNELQKLSNDCVLINDFSITFSKPIFNSFEKYYVKSIQIDHLLVTPGGLFSIETKNWSKKSLENLNLFSPIQQSERSKFALNKIVSDNLGSIAYSLKNHHWGKKKVPIYNLIVMVNEKPLGDFEGAKVLVLNELLGYINFFKPVLSNIEVFNIADFLMGVDERKIY
jgi:hypothetical protein